MQDALILTGIATLTVLATGLGAIPVMLLGARAEALRPVLSGVAMGVMGVAAVVGLLIPAVKEGTPAQVVGARPTGPRGSPSASSSSTAFPRAWPSAAPTPPPARWGRS